VLTRTVKAVPSPILWVKKNISSAGVCQCLTTG
jgi:hypothetical protein